MKNLKKFLLFSIMFVAVIAFACFFGLRENKTSAEAATIDQSIFNYISVSVDGQTLSSSNFKTIDNTTYIISNDSITVNFDSYNNNFSINDSTNLTYFIPKTKSVTITKDEEENTFPGSFVLNNKTYYYAITNMGVLEIYDDVIKTGRLPIITQSYSDFISYTQDENQIVITYIISYTLKSSAPDTNLTFVRKSNLNAASTYTLSFMRPVSKFSDEPVFSFACYGLDAGDDLNQPDVSTKIQNERSYKRVEMTILNNNYTEQNPLYFNINYNGFIYNFEFYSKYIESADKECLFVNYVDSKRPSNNEFLATGIYEDNFINLVNKYNSTEFNYFTLYFTDTGRYEIEFYDITYKCGLKDYNYFSKSFYIKGDNASEFDNVYIISQTLKDNGDEIEYIVSSSTLNNNVKTTIKNLSYYLANDTVLEDSDVVLDIKVTTFGGSSNIPTTTSYTKAQLVSMLNRNEKNKNDLTFTYSDDAFYEFNIYKYKIEEYLNSNNENVNKKIRISDERDANYWDYNIYYNYTIVKTAKTTFTIELYDEDGKPVVDSNNKQKTQTYEATTPYRTITMYYKKNIISPVNLSVSFSIDDANTYETFELEKTYVNNYHVNYAVQAVNIETFDVLDSDKKVLDQLNIRIEGIGDITVNVTLNGVTTTYILNSEQGRSTLTFTEYGKYYVSVVDSMGTTSSEMFAYEKQLSISAILLIVFSAIIVLAIVAFIIISRAKLKTR